MTVSACLWLGLFPLLQFGSYSTITYNKWTFMLVLACFSLFSMVNGRHTERIGHTGGKAFYTPVILAAAFTGWIILSCLISPYPSWTWLLGSSARMEGLLTQLCYIGLFFMFAFRRVQRKPVLISATAGIICYCVVVILQRSGVNVFGLYPRGRSYATTPEFQGTIGNIDMAVGYLCLASGLFLTEIVSIVPGLIRYSGDNSHRPKSTVHYFLVLSAGLGTAVYLIVTMNVQFGLITLAVLCLLTLLRFLPRRLWKPVLIILAVLVMCMIWFWPGQSGGIWELKEILHGRVLYSFGSNRLGVWIYSMQMAPERLLTGSGSGTFVFRFRSFMNQNGYQLPTSQGGVPLGTNFDAPHNEYIAYLINNGLPAVLLFAALVLAVAFARRKPAGSKVRVSPADRICTLSPWAATVVCYAVQAFFSFSVCLVAPMFWVVAGICVSDVSAVTPAAPPEHTDRPRRSSPHSRKKAGRS